MRAEIVGQQFGVARLRGLRGSRRDEGGGEEDDREGARGEHRHGVLASGQKLPQSFPHHAQQQQQRRVTAPGAVQAPAGSAVFCSRQRAKGPSLISL
jgi:hypothetical protein